MSHKKNTDTQINTLTHLRDVMKTPKANKDTHTCIQTYKHCIINKSRPRTNAISSNHKYKSRKKYKLPLRWIYLSVYGNIFYLTIHFHPSTTFDKICIYNDLYSLKTRTERDKQRDERKRKI